MSLAVAGAAACAKDEPPGIKVELLAPVNPAQRPEIITFYWLGPSGTLINEQLPETGTLPPTGDVLTSVFIDTGQTLDELRALVVVGERARSSWPERPCGSSPTASAGGPCNCRWAPRCPTRTATASPTWSSVTV
jgi:hypothetical protein